MKTCNPEVVITAGKVNDRLFGKPPLARETLPSRCAAGWARDFILLVSGKVPHTLTGLTLGGEITKFSWEGEGYFISLSLAKPIKALSLSDPSHPIQTCLDAIKNHPKESHHGRV